MADHDERKAARALWRLLGGASFVAPGTRAELCELGIDLPAWLREGQPAAGDIVVCMRLTVPLLTPGNAAGNCHACRAPIQFRRALAGSVAVFLCVSCALSRYRGDA